jgi:hypothetical protein
MTVATAPHKTGSPSAMLSALRSAGAKGMTRDELFDSAKVSAPSYVAEVLRDQGHSITEELEHVAGIDGPESGVTTRFTLMVDADPQQPLLEGERTDQLGTWRENAIAWDEQAAR